MRMADPSGEVRAEYRRRRPILEDLLQEVIFCLEHAPQVQSIKTHSISGRIKDEDSFVGKIARKGYTEPFRQAEDLVGARIVCLFLDDLPALKAAVADEFEVIKSEDKISAVAPESFGYMSHHFVCMLKSTSSGRRYEKLVGERFEIQCRTILMDAWANVSHYLSYKGERSIPAELRKDFFALSGLLYVADRQFASLYQAAETSVRTAEEALREGGDISDEINLSNTLALLEASYPDRTHTEASDVSELVEELAAVGVTRLAELRQLLQDGDLAAKRYEESYSRGLGYTGKNWFTDLGIARQAIALVHRDYREAMYPDDEELRSFAIKRDNSNRRKSRRTKGGSGAASVDS